MKSYGVSLDQLIAVTQSSNSLIAAGALEGATGRFAVKVPALIEKPQDMLQVPIAATPGATVTLGDVAQVRPTFKDATSVTRVERPPGDDHRGVEAHRREPDRDRRQREEGRRDAQEDLAGRASGLLHAGQVEDHPADAGGSAELRHRPACCWSRSSSCSRSASAPRCSSASRFPPRSWRACSAFSSPGLTVNIVVLFSLILAVGMLVDDAIIVSEFAERRMAEGMPPREAYSLAAKRMAGPVIAATADARRGLLAALVLAGHRRRVHEVHADHADRDAVGVAGRRAVLHADARRAARPRRAGAARRPRQGPAVSTCGPCGSRCAIRASTLLLALVVLVAVQMSLWQIRPRRRVLPQGRAGLRPGHCPRPRQPLARREGPPRARRRGPRPQVRRACRPSTRAPASSRAQSNEISEDTIGVIQFEFAELAEAPARARDHGCDPREDRGHSRHPRRGDRAARAVRRPASRCRSSFRRSIPTSCPRPPRRSRRSSAQRPDVRDIDDGLPLPGIDWRLEVNKAEAAKYQANVSSVGTAVQLVTNGVKVTEYRPSDSDKAVDILVRFPRGPAQPRPDRRSARADAGRPRADRQLRRRASRRSASASSTASAASA